MKTGRNVREKRENKAKPTSKALKKRFNHLVSHEINQFHLNPTGKIGGNQFYLVGPARQPGKQHKESIVLERSLALETTLDVFWSNKKHENWEKSERETRKQSETDQQSTEETIQSLGITSVFFKELIQNFG